MRELLKRIKYLFTGTSKVKAGYTFVSNIKLEDIPKGEWVYLATKFEVDESNNYWVEDTKIMTDTSSDRKLFIGELEDIKFTPNK